QHGQDAPPLQQNIALIDATLRALPTVQDPLQRLLAMETHERRMASSVDRAVDRALHAAVCGCAIPDNLTKAQQRLNALQDEIVDVTGTLTASLQGLRSSLRALVEALPEAAPSLMTPLQMLCSSDECRTTEITITLREILLTMRFAQQNASKESAPETSA
ncbi:MAG: hypothetical protein PHH13_04335, partial [Candidatus Peribacteraceae bacterium]|nr:hypothetical protein [Candidatus Peribacteraceae bacterium]